MVHAIGKGSSWGSKGASGDIVCGREFFLHLFHIPELYIWRWTDEPAFGIIALLQDRVG
jgi:hypothetical protein